MLTIWQNNSISEDTTHTNTLHHYFIFVFESLLSAADICKNTINDITSKTCLNQYHIIQEIIPIL